MGSSALNGTADGRTRGQIIWERLRERRDKEPVSFARAKIVTRSYKESEGLPLFIRRAKAFDAVMREIPIYLDDDMLLVGDFSVRPMAAEIFPELTVSWIKDYMDSGAYDQQDPNDTYAFEPNQKEEILEVCEYWKDHSLRESFYKYLGKDYVDYLYELNEQGAWIFAASTEAQTEKGWNIPDFSRVVRRGLRGLLEDIDAAYAKIPMMSDENVRQRTFLEALRSMIHSSIHYAHRYADLCRQEAERHEGKRREELLTMAEVCDWVPENPARTFLEAVQSMWFCHLLIYWDSRTVGLGFGRVDQYLYPYYRQDIESGLIDREEATQILECLRIKIMGKRNVFNVTIRAALTNDSHFHNCTLGGQTIDGRDAVNELSYVWLDAAERVRTPHPTLSVRWHEQIDPDFVMRCIEINKLGLGFPAWFNDEPTIEYLLERGATLAEARDYAIGGCVLHNLVGKTPTTWPSVMNYAKIFELAMNDGVDPRLGKPFGPKTGRFEDFERYEDLVEAFKAQSMHFIRESTDYLNKVSMFRSDYLPETFVSLFFDGCIEKARSVAQGGAKYQINNYYVLPVGIVDVANALYAVKKLVYEEKQVDRAELMKALHANFEGYEELQQKLWAVPKYGNDCAEVDYICADLYEWFCDFVNTIPAPYGARYEVAPHSIAFHANMGLKTGALPSGRKAGLSLADGAVSPAQGTDTEGPTAVINSAGRIDHTRIFGTLFNMKFMPRAMAEPEDRKKVANLIRTFFGTYKGKHIQFNVVDRETLIDAKAHPENYRNLIVRVAGYSALWVELNTAVQDELIARTSNDF
ncbi:MAG: glycyl radical protein [Oscillospiraceae bacterium]